MPVDDDWVSEGEEDPWIPWVDGTDPCSTPSIADPPRETGTGGHDGQAQHLPKQGQSGPKKRSVFILTVLLSLLDVIPLVMEFILGTHGLEL